MQLTTASLMLTLLIASSGMVSCGARTLPNPKPTATSSVNPSASPSTTPVSRYAYALPLRVKAEPECEGTSQLLYQVDATGNLRYYPGDYNAFASDQTTTAMQQRQLSDTELSDLNQVIAEIDIAKQFESSKKVPADAPRTMECRTVMTYSLTVNGEARTYDANGRDYSHTQAYKDGLARLQQKLKTLAGSSIPAQSVHYGPALKLYKYAECDQSSVVEFELSSRSELRSLVPGTETTPIYQTRNLSRLEIKEMDDFLNSLDLYNQYQKQEKIPEGSPQTEECRTIDRLDLDVDGSSRTFDGKRSRSIKPSDSYLQLIEKLRSKLRELASR